MQNQNIQYQPQPQTYPQNPQMAQTNMPGRQDFVVVHDASKAPPVASGELPQRFFCSTCGREQSTSVYHKMGLGSWICFVFWLFVFFPFILFPCCASRCKDSVHVCPGCQREVGRKKFLV